MGPRPVVKKRKRHISLASLKTKQGLHRATKKTDTKHHGPGAHATNRMSTELNHNDEKTEILVNGSARALTHPILLSDLLEQLSFNTKALAVEVNLELVPRAKHTEFQIKPGDELEIVTLAGGG